MNSPAGHTRRSYPPQWRVYFEHGPIHRVERGDGVLIPTYVPHLIVDCFANTLATMAASGHQRAVALSGRIDLSELLKRTDT